MRKYQLILVLALATVICTGTIMANKAADGEGDCIVISPNTLVLSKDTDYVTVHSNVLLSLVVPDSLLLDGVSPAHVGADSLGHLVAKFDEKAIKAIVQPGQATLTLTLTGFFLTGEPLEASDTITVRE